MGDVPEPKSRRRASAVYAAMIGLAAIAIARILTAGEGLRAPSPIAPGRVVDAAASAHGTGPLHVLVALLLIVAVSRALGALFRRFDQPAVVGEVIAGIALGPSLLGRVAPEFSAYVFPATVTAPLHALAQIGVILFMFLVGVELDTGLLRDKAHAAIAISHASIVAPFVLGAATSLGIYPLLSTSDVPFPIFAMFMGVAMSITAFPVLARILADRGMQKSRIGVLALSCAAVDDATAWCLLAIVVSLASPGAHDPRVTVALTFGYIALLAFVLRPLVHRYVRAEELRHDVGGRSIALVVIGLLVSAIVTEAIGIHAIFGAFLLGAILPHDSLLARTLRERLEDVVVVLFLPVFFAFSGLRTQIGLVHGTQAWTICVLLIVVACVGKIGGTFVAARLTGLAPREAAMLGALMNTRGLMELVVLNLGLDLGVISPTLFAMMVLMALVTTFATSPLLSLLDRSATAPSGLGSPVP